MITHQHVIKGAFNGVAGDVLLERLRRRRIPETLACWIEDFLRKRQATISVNNSVTPVVELHHAGLPQGSPLSPILFLFFNADLVESKINKNGGAIAFIDDYSAWVTGDSLEHNINLLQDTTVPRVLGWAKASGAVFQAKKTQLTYFTRNKRFSDSPNANQPLIMGDQSIVAKPVMKILGVILDSGLKYKEHILRARDKGIKAALALKRLRNLRPETARKLFHSKVTPITDYASPIWASAATQDTNLSN